jgi:UDP-N-acetylglucosamine acyltransferase
MPDIHPTAIVERGATIAGDVVVGPFCIVGASASLEAGVRLRSHVVVSGNTTIGEATEIYPFATVGLPPQDMKYSGEPSRLVIGRNNRIREHVTIHTGTAGGGLLTTIGDNCLIMVGAHVAHDCHIGNNVVMANNAVLGGHVAVGDFAILGGMCAVHQFVRIGVHAMIGGMSGVEHDVIPYGLVLGERARLHGLNLIGLRRRGFERDDIDSLRKAYNLLFGKTGTMSDRVSDVEEFFGESALVRDLIGFVMAESTRALCLPKNANGG